jgi:hypothetical protein
MTLGYSKTQWTTPHAVPLHYAPFAALEETPATPSAPFGTQQGVALVLIGLGMFAVCKGIREGSRRRESY